ncbi:MAG: hypothetical protein HY371_05425 [Devosia nanyangense]|nr:hypothetical protein [Devosia nanyangense]
MIPTRFIENSLRYKADRMLRLAQQGGKPVDMVSPPTVTLGAGNSATTLSGSVQQILTPSPIFTQGAIKSAIEAQMRHGVYTPSMTYYQLNTSKLIRNVLKTVPLYTQKKFHDL